MFTKLKWTKRWQTSLHISCAKNKLGGGPVEKNTLNDRVVKNYFSLNNVVSIVILVHSFAYLLLKRLFLLFSFHHLFSIFFSTVITSSIWVVKKNQTGRHTYGQETNLKPYNRRNKNSNNKKIPQFSYVNLKINSFCQKTISNLEKSHFSKHSPHKKQTLLVISENEVMAQCGLLLKPIHYSTSHLGWLQDWRVIYPTEIISNSCADRSLADIRRKLLGAKSHLEQTDLSAQQNWPDLTQLMIRPFVMRAIVITQPGWFMPWLALTPHKLEHFKGAMHNDPTSLSAVPDYPLLIHSCSSSSK